VCRSFDDTWPYNFRTEWAKELKEKQIESMSNSDLFPYPDFISHPERIVDWSLEEYDQSKYSDQGVQVTLVTQCSMDRLSNLQAQLQAWTGMASVSVYLKHNEDINEANNAITKCIKEAKENSSDTSHWDVAVTLCHNDVDDAPYPINMLRNLAFLEAKRRQQELNIVKGAVFLVDVDFRPSTNLFHSLHSVPAATAICDEHKVIVCPAFEFVPRSSTNVPSTIEDLFRGVDAGTVEGFHTSQFPQGHCPTDFARFWSVSRKFSTVHDMWKNSYPVSYQECFEPYVIMATCDVPLYDERFQGYGLNKVSHLASVAANITGQSSGFHVLPGAFIVAPIHKRSESWSNIYGSKTDDAKFNRLWLKGLYRNFTKRLKDGKGPMLSPMTKSWMMTNFVRKEIDRKDSINIDKDTSPLVVVKNQQQKDISIVDIASGITTSLPSPLISDIIVDLFSGDNLQ